MSYPTAFILRGGESITGSFNKIQTLASGSGSAEYYIPAYFTALIDGNGNNLISGSNMFLPVGSTLDLIFTSASLDATSAPILIFV